MANPAAATPPTIAGSRPRIEDVARGAIDWTFLEIPSHRQDLLMARPVSTAPTESEQAILEILWRKKEASVREVTDELSKTRPVAYTTVLTIFKILTKKGYVRHRTEGRAFIYRPTLSRQQVRRNALKQMLAQFFGGSPRALAEHLLSERELDLVELAALQKKVAAERAKGHSR
jgi:predicted transcriptional regulator